MKNILLVLSLSISLVYISCSDKIPVDIEPEIEVEEEIEENCLYIFPEGINDLFGSWEPKYVIDLATNDTVHYDTEMGHTGHMIDSYYYADSYELRDSNEVVLYYVINGRKCNKHSNLKWSYEQNNLVITNMQDTFFVPVISIAKNELVVEDRINAIYSRIAMRRTN